MVQTSSRRHHTDPRFLRFLDARDAVGDRILARSPRSGAPFGATGTVDFALLDQVGRVFLGVSWDLHPPETAWCPPDVLKDSTLVIARRFERPLPQRRRCLQFTLDAAFAHLGREVRVARPPVRGVMARGDRGSVYHVVADGPRLLLGVWWAKGYSGVQDWMWFSRADYECYLTETENGSSERNPET